MKSIIAAMGLAAALLWTEHAAAVDLTYAGSVTILEGVMRGAAPAFEKKTGLNIGLAGGGSGAGIKAVLAGLVDIGGVSRDLKAEEIAQGLVASTIGYGAVGVVANKAIPIDNLTSEQVKDIMTGKVTNWREVGGPNLPIRIVISTPGCACREEFQDMVLRKEPYAQNAIVSPMRTLSETVHNTPGAIGPLATAVVDADKVKIISIDGVAPTSENVKSKRYKISRQVNLVTRGVPAGNAKKFIDFMLSPEGQELVGKSFVRVK